MIKYLVLVLSFTYTAFDVFIQFLLLYLEHVNINVIVLHNPMPWIGKKIITFQDTITESLQYPVDLTCLDIQVGARYFAFI